MPRLPTAGLELVMQGMSNFQSNMYRVEYLINGLSGPMDKVDKASKTAWRSFGVLGSMAAMAGGAMALLAKPMVEEAAKVEQMTRATDIAAQAMGIQREAIVAERAELAKLPISFSEATESMSEFIISGVDISKVGDLTKASMDLAALSGKKVADVMDDMTRAVTNASVITLRSYGITTSAGRIFGSYAETLRRTGKDADATAESLTALQRREALLAYILTVASRINGLYAQSQDTVLGKLRLLSVEVIKLGQELGTQMMPPIKALLNLALQLVAALRALSPEVKGMLGGFMAFGSAAGVLVGSLVVALPTLRVFQSAFSALPVAILHSLTSFVKLPLAISAGAAQLQRSTGIFASFLGVFTKETVKNVGATVGSVFSQTAGAIKGSVSASLAGLGLISQAQGEVGAQQERHAQVVEKVNDRITTSQQRAGVAAANVGKVQVAASAAHIDAIAARSRAEQREIQGVQKLAGVTLQANAKVTDASTALTQLELTNAARVTEGVGKQAAAMSTGAAAITAAQARQNKAQANSVITLNKLQRAKDASINLTEIERVSMDGISKSMDRTILNTQRYDEATVASTGAAKKAIAAQNALAKVKGAKAGATPATIAKAEQKALNAAVAARNAAAAKITANEVMVVSEREYTRQVSGYVASLDATKAKQASREIAADKTHKLALRDKQVAEKVTSKAIADANAKVARTTQSNAVLGARVAKTESDALSKVSVARAAAARKQVQVQGALAGLADKRIVAEQAVGKAITVGNTAVLASQAKAMLFGQQAAKVQAAGGKIIANSFGRVAAASKGVGSAILSTLLVPFKALLGVLPAIGKALIGGLGKIAQGVGYGLLYLLDVIKNLLLWIVKIPFSFNTVLLALGAFTALVLMNTGNLRDALKGLPNAIVAAFSDLVPWFKALGSVIGDAFRSLSKTMDTVLGPTIRKVLSSMFEQKGPELFRIRDMDKSIAAAATMSKAFTYVGASAKSAMDKANAAVKTTGRTIDAEAAKITKIRFDPEKFFMGGVNIMVAFGRGIMQGAIYVMNTITAVLSWIAARLIGMSPPTEGPLANIDVGGLNLIKAWINGMSKAPLTAIKALAKKIKVQLAAAELGVQDIEFSIRLREMDYQKQLWPFEKALMKIEAKAKRIVIPLQQQQRKIDWIIRGVEKQIQVEDDLLRTLDDQTAALDKQLKPYQNAVDLAEAAANLVLIPMQQQQRALEKQRDIMQENFDLEESRINSRIELIRKEGEELRKIADLDKQRLDVIDWELFIEEQRNKILDKASSKKQIELESAQRAMAVQISNDEKATSANETRVSAEEDALAKLQKAYEARLKPIEDQLKIIERTIANEEERVQLAQDALTLEQARQAAARISIEIERSVIEERRVALERQVEALNRQKALLQDQIDQQNEIVQLAQDALDLAEARRINEKIAIEEARRSLEETQMWLQHYQQILQALADSAGGAADALDEVFEPKGGVGEGFLDKLFEKMATPEMKEKILKALMPLGADFDAMRIAWTKMVNVIKDVLFGPEIFKGGGQANKDPERRGGLIDMLMPKIKEFMTGLDAWWTEMKSATTNWANGNIGDGTIWSLIGILFNLTMDDIGLGVTARQKMIDDISGAMNEVFNKVITKIGDDWDVALAMLLPRMALAFLKFTVALKESLVSGTVAAPSMELDEGLTPEMRAAIKKQNDAIAKERAKELAKLAPSPHFPPTVDPLAMLEGMPGGLGNVAKMVAQFKQTGFATAEGFFVGFREGLEANAVKIEQLFNDYVINPVKKFLGIKSPSTVFYDIGIECVEGLIKGVGDWIKKSVSDIEEHIKNFVKIVGDWVVKNWNLIWQIGRDTINSVSKGVGDWITKNVTAIQQHISNFVQKIIDWISSNASKIWAIGSDLISKVSTGVGNWITTNVAAIQAHISNFVQKIRDWLVANVNAVLQLGQDLISKISAGISTWITNNAATLAGYGAAIFAGVKTGIETAITVALQATSDFWKSLQSIGQGILDGIQAGVIAGWQTFVNWLNNKWNSLPEFLRKIFDMGSPSKVFMTIGEGIVQGMQQGILNTLPDLKKTMSKVEATASGAYGGKIEGHMVHQTTINNYYTNTKQGPRIDFQATYARQQSESTVRNDLAMIARML